tara:strand:+ start:732 stop:884 length:153 start_codon:yes stop_codon:yes gene_type:complete
MVPGHMKIENGFGLALPMRCFIVPNCNYLLLQSTMKVIAKPKRYFAVPCD